MSQRNEWVHFEEIFKQNDSDQAVSVLRNRYNPNYLIEYENKDGKGLLHMSVELDKPKIAEYLLSIGCNRGQINRQDGRSPLALALSLPHVSEELFRLLFVQQKVCYFWRHITGHSKTLEFGNENIAEIFRSHVTSYLHTFFDDNNVDADNDNDNVDADNDNDNVDDDNVDDDNVDDDNGDDEWITCRTVSFLHHLGWPLESLSFLRLCDTSTGFAQLCYATADADAIKVKHCLDDNNYGPSALAMTLKLAVTVTNPKSTVIMKLLVDKGGPLLTEKFKDLVFSFDMLDNALMQNDVDKVMILMDSGIKFVPWLYYYDEELTKTRNRITENTLLNVFVKPTIIFDDYFILYLCELINEDFLNAVTRYHSRIESFEFPDMFKTSKRIYSLFVKCRLELAKMKDTVAYENLSVLDIIDKPLDTIASYTCNKKFIEKLEAIEFKKSFPYFSDVILKRLEVARRIRDWTDRSKDFLAECLPVISSNNLILSMIVKYVGVPNLIVMSLE